MATKFYTLEEAAQQLGLSVEELNEARLAGRIHGYRDGTSWKFKVQEVERVSDEMSASAAGTGTFDLDEDLDDVIGLSEGSDVAEAEPVKAEGGSGTAIGNEAAGTSDVDLGLGESDLDLEAISDLRLEPASDLELAGMSDVESQGGSDVLSGSSLDVDGGTGELELASSDVSGRSDALDFGGGSDLELGGDDDELVLEGSGVGSDLSLASGDTGINLAAPSESGLSLEDEPLELEGSSAPSLELPEDEDMISLEMEAADPDDATQLKPDEDFQLSPSMEGIDESDSGSQVIALEDSEAFDETTAILRPTEEVLLGADDEGLVAAGPLGEFGEPGMEPRPRRVGPEELPEAPYSIWNVLLLMIISFVVLMSGLLMVDVVRNMWSFQEGFGATTSLMDTMIRMFGIDS